MAEVAGKNLARGDQLSEVKGNSRKNTLELKSIFNPIY